MNININPDALNFKPHRRTFGILPFITLLVTGGAFIWVGLIGMGVVGDANTVEKTGPDWFIYIFPVAGVFIVVLGFISFVRALQRNADIKRILQTGRKVQGVLTDVTVKGDSKRTDYRIVVAAPDLSGVVQSYISDSVNNIGGLAMADFHNTPIPIDVYLDSSDPKKYYVDISDIPNLTMERITELLQKAQKEQTASSINAPNQHKPLF